MANEQDLIAKGGSKLQGGLRKAQQQQLKLYSQQ